jgi:hypothetical protein
MKKLMVDKLVNADESRSMCGMFLSILKLLLLMAA